MLQEFYLILQYNSLSTIKRLKTTLMFKPQHAGIYFTDEHIQQAQKNRDSEPYAAAWARLHEMSEADGLIAAQLNGLRYRFEGNDDAGEKTVDLLRHGDINIGEDTIYIEAVAVALT